MAVVAPSGLGRSFRCFAAPSPPQSRALSILMKNIAIFLLVISSPAVIAQGPDYQTLEGSLFIWGDHLPDGKEKDLDGLSLFIKGEAAERLYKKMKSTAIYNECYSDGTVTKRQGMFECNMSKAGAYDCNFGVSTKEGKVYGAESC